MAIKLVTEVMDWAPATLTHREHKVLIILAENARLPSRQTWDSVESPRILRQAQLTARQMHEVLAALVAKGCLRRPVAGGRNHRAKYAIARLAPPQTYEAVLATLSPAERQAVRYAGWWVDPDDVQCAENPHTENHDQHAGFTETEHGSATCGNAGSVCGKAAPRLPVTARSGKADVEDADRRSIRSPDVAQQRRAAEGGMSVRPDVSPPTPSQTRKRVHDGTNPDGPDVQQIPIEVHLQSQATDRNAREACPVCGVKHKLRTNGKLTRHGPKFTPCRGSGMAITAAAS
jgi:hypothetical protein